MRSKFHILALLAFCLVGALLLVGWQESNNGIYDSPMLLKAIEDIGYEAKNISINADKPLYEFTIVRDGLNVPIAAEVTSSKTYIWLTVFLGNVKEDEANATKLRKLLQANANYQPAQFFITKVGALKLGLPVANRALTNAILRKEIDKLVNAVVETKAVWQL